MNCLTPALPESIVGRIKSVSTGGFFNRQTIKLGCRLLPSSQLRGSLMGGLNGSIGALQDGRTAGN
jgi:hypothetical protein